MAISLHSLALQCHTGSVQVMHFRWLISHELALLPIQKYFRKNVKWRMFILKLTFQICHKYLIKSITQIRVKVTFNSCLSALFVLTKRKLNTKELLCKIIFSRQRMTDKSNVHTILYNNYDYILNKVKILRYKKPAILYTIDTNCSTTRYNRMSTQYLQFSILNQPLLSVCLNSCPTIYTHSRTHAVHCNKIWQSYFSTIRSFIFDLVDLFLPHAKIDLKYDRFFMSWNCIEWPKNISRAKSKLALWTQTLLTNALYHRLVDGFLLRCCMFILSYDYHRKYKIQRNFESKISQLEWSNCHSKDSKNWAINPCTSNPRSSSPYYHCSYYQFI